MSPAALELRRRIFEGFAATGEAPVLPDTPELRELTDAHVIVLDSEGRIRMAHPFAGHRLGARLQADGRTWWGNCAWDALGIAAALGLQNAAITSNDITITLEDGRLAAEAVFHVAVPARRWWQDIADT